MIVTKVEFKYRRMGPNGIPEGTDEIGTLTSWNEGIVTDVEILGTAQKVMKKYHPERFCGCFTIVSIEAVPPKRPKP